MAAERSSSQYERRKFDAVPDWGSSAKLRVFDFEAVGVLVGAGAGGMNDEMSSRPARLSGNTRSRNSAGCERAIGISSRSSPDLSASARGMARSSPGLDNKSVARMKTTPVHTVRIPARQPMDHRRSPRGLDMKCARRVAAEVRTEAAGPEHIDGLRGLLENLPFHRWIPALRRTKDGAALSAASPDPVRDLRVEYTRTFLMNVHPYESVYLDESGMLNAASSADGPTISRDACDTRPF